MGIYIRPPHITGKTVAEQVHQLIGYLSRLAQQLGQLPETQTVTREPETQQAAPGSFLKLRVRKSLTVDGGINGVYVRSIRVWGANEFTVQTRFTQWGSDGNRQSFLLSGCSDYLPVLGVIRVSSHGGVAWSGTQGVSVATEPGGILRVTLPYVCYDHFLLQSPQEFTI